ncbi:hypothetical protein WH47_05128 [Habropoda laboriosa]|uniref:Uncharacterized protein n=1 Tax=Habropoda laboriosa TaxID=597456 RepID=A0A0L7QSJ8_9HYME|nr:PREDICTED: uncharacterized protein LOC108575862 [Habropoda laboriosa]KOC61524.1 hypothetical protein WH47_05128 [Habropoda laboriosa]
MGLGNIARFIKQYWAVGTFPTLSALTIYADWNHTRLWKKKLAEETNLKLSY